MDQASQVLALDVPSGVCRSLRALADQSNVTRITLQHCGHEQRSIEEKARSQYYLHPWEESVLVKFLVRQDTLGRPVRIKYLGEIAFNLACRRRAPTDRPLKPPGRNWPQSFY